jgi:hypothetical protein
MALKISLSRFAPFGLGALYLLLATPAARTLLEATMSTHMLIQIPLLVVVGILAGCLLPERCQGSLLAVAGGAIPCVVMAIFASSYWMLPRALDAAQANPLTEAAKFITLPALAGLPLALAWKQLSAIGRGFVWTNFISMLAVLGWLYIAAPVRLCNSYLLDQQTGAGWLMVQLAILLFAGWLGTLFVSRDCPPRGSGAAEGTVNLAEYAELAELGATPRTGY